jgi:hypothetical protein
MQSIDSAVRTQIALGMAQQLLDEQSTKMYFAVGDSPTSSIIGATSSEAVSPRQNYTAIGAYNGLRTQPPTDLYAIPLGTDDGDGTTRDPNFQVDSNTFSRWKQQVDVYYVTDSAPTTPISSGGSTNYRMTCVQILYNDPFKGWQTLASLTKVFSYVPSP